VSIIPELIAATLGAASLGEATRAWLKARYRLLRIKVDRADGTQVEVRANLHDPEQAKLFIEALASKLPEDEREDEK